MVRRTLAWLKARPYFVSVLIAFAAIGYSHTTNQESDRNQRDGLRASAYASCYNRQSLVVALNGVGEYLKADAHSIATTAGTPQRRRDGRRLERRVDRGLVQLRRFSFDCRPLLSGRPPVSGYVEDGKPALIGPDPSEVPRR